MNPIIALLLASLCVTIFLGLIARIDFYGNDYLKPDSKYSTNKFKIVEVDGVFEIHRKYATFIFCRYEYEAKANTLKDAFETIEKLKKKKPKLVYKTKK
jgi:hypothetical protein